MDWWSEEGKWLLGVLELGFEVEQTRSEAKRSVMLWSVF